MFSGRARLAPTGQQELHVDTAHATDNITLIGLLRPWRLRMSFDRGPTTFRLDTKRCRRHQPPPPPQTTVDAPDTKRRNGNLGTAG